MKPIRILDDIYTDYQRVYFSCRRGKDSNTTPELLFNVETVSGETKKHSYDIAYRDKEIQSLINISSDGRILKKENDLTDWLVALYGDNYSIIDLKRDVIKKAVRDSLQIKYKVLLVKSYIGSNVNVYLKTIPGHIILRDIETDDIYIIWNGLNNNDLSLNHYSTSKYNLNMKALFEYITKKIGDCGNWRDSEQVNVEAYDDYEHLLNSIPAGNGKVIIQDVYKDYMKCEEPEKVKYAYKLQDVDIRDKSVALRKINSIEKGIMSNFKIANQDKQFVVVGILNEYGEEVMDYEVSEK